LRVLVTGASGFIGRWAVAGLVRRKVDIFALARRPITTAGVHTVTADLFDSAAVQRVLTEIRPDALLHLAWTVEPNLFWNAPENTDWIDATMWLARSAVDAGASRIVGVGTCFEYAWPNDGVCDEKTTPAVPTTLYAIAKDATRRGLAGLSAGRNISFAWARLFFLYGPFEHPSRLVPSIAINLARGLQAPLSSGRQVRDFMDVRDAGDALAALTVSRVESEVNIASGRPVTLMQIADCLGQLAGRPDLIARGVLPDRPHEPPRIVAATKRLLTEVGLPAARPLEQGLGDSYAWWQAQAASMA
jgi:nucleoside-diphosphate-sugar epimerase